MKQTTHIRFAAESDAAAMADLYRPYVLETVYTFEYEPPDGTAFAGRLRRTQPDFPWLAAERDGQLLGYAYASRAFERAAAWDGPFTRCWSGCLSARAIRWSMGWSRAKTRGAAASTKPWATV